MTSRADWRSAAALTRAFSKSSFLSGDTGDNGGKSGNGNTSNRIARASPVTTDRNRVVASGDTVEFVTTVTTPFSTVEQSGDTKKASHTNGLQRVSPLPPLSPPFSDEVSFSPEHLEIGGDWADRLAALDPDVDPCPGFLRGQWREIRALALQTLAERRDELRALGFDAVSLFGVHPIVGRVRMDCVGALVCTAHPVVMVAAGVVTYANGNRWYASRLPVPAVPIWDFEWPQRTAPT